MDRQARSADRHAARHRSCAGPAGRRQSRRGRQEREKVKQARTCPAALWFRLCQHQLKVKSILAEPPLVVTVKTTAPPAGRVGVVAVSLPSPLTVNCAAELPNFTDWVSVNPEPVIVTGVGVPCGAWGGLASWIVGAAAFTLPGARMMSTRRLISSRNVFSR